MRSFEDLIKDLEFTDLDLNGIEISEYEIGMRVQSLFNGYSLAEDRHRNLINNLSFGLNLKLLEGCQAKELLQFYNERIGGILDDFVF